MEDLFALQDEDVLTGQLKYRKARLPEADALVAAESARVQISSEVADLQIERLDHARRQNRFEGEVAELPRHPAPEGDCRPSTRWLGEVCDTW